MQRTECLCSPQIHRLASYPSVMAVGGGALGDDGHEGGVLRKGISAQNKGTPWSSLALPHMWAQPEDGSLQSASRLSQNLSMRDP